MGKKLKIALIHLDVKYRDVKTNCDALIKLNQKACENGAKIIVNTEMGISGFSFLSMEKIAPCALSKKDKFIIHLKQIAKRYNAYICIGFAQKEENSSLFYNSAFVIGPVGRIILKYHKINAETRWACPGNPVQDNIFETPWAKVGVLICSDTFHGLLPRQTALKGADIIIVPANWPLSGLDPNKLWSVRARENGIYIAACNRCGKDRIMICDNAMSSVFSPDGKIMVSKACIKSEIIYASLPLNAQAKVKDITRPGIMASRTPEKYGSIYLDMRHVNYDGSDLTAYYNLRAPELFKIICFTGHAQFSKKDIVEKIRSFLDQPSKNFTLLVFPKVYAIQLDQLVPDISNIIKGKNMAVCFGIIDKNGCMPVLISNESCSFAPYDAKGLCIVDTGPARIGLCRSHELMHPETGVAFAKLGCDALITSLEYLSMEDLPIMASRTLDRICVAVSAENYAMISTPPTGHGPWKEVGASGPDFCSENIDLEKIREKTFQDRVDFKILLSININKTGKEKE